MHLKEDRPITDAAEVAAFLGRLPLLIDRGRFTRFVLGFPHGYLETTSPAEVLKHFALVESLGARDSVSTLTPQSNGFKLVVVARDRHALFARIALSVAARGANIVRAEAIGNSEGLVLDTFHLSDPDGRLSQPEDRRRLQGLIEESVGAALDVAARLAAVPEADEARGPLVVHWGEGSIPGTTLLSLRGPDSVGLLGRIARAIAECDCDIALARVDTPGGWVEDELHLSFEGGPLTAGVRERVEVAIAALDARAAPLSPTRG